MRWRGRRQSENVEDRRGSPGRRVALGGGGLGTIIIIVLVLLGVIDPRALLQMGGGGGGAPAPQNPAAQQQNQELKDFVSVVLADTEDVWNKVFPEEFGRQYREPDLVLFTQSVNSGCGYASSQVGPFYCPADQKVYLDLGFFHELSQRFGAPGDFAMAYVVAHEVGHHVQNMTEQMARSKRGESREGKNRMSVRLELQADFLAGVWAHYGQKEKKFLEPGDIEEAINAANQIGDDTLQREAQGHAVPDSFTHGTAAQRARWFRRGFETGDVSLMDELFELPYDRL
ncbi:KPN_02809 family neutral zinc metallopeptidase [Thalassoroseus pseudoceratinae]|uniref:KPN_02809 family neutral zinc metallopeptidase n=1 Tax=Thalassoroseus pseudoceratinae TaxID=2713176 RepID=UPI0014229EA8|nr:neutral zinc metallopeptidase [Thalassoroseus pseudoceratinae]